MVARQSGMPRSNLRRGAATEVDKLDSFDDSFDTDKVAGTARPDMDSREAKLAARFARGAHTTASVAIAKAAEATQARTSILNEGVMTQTYTTRVTLKMRADADIKSDPAGEMSGNSCVTVREWRVLADGTRRAHVCEVGSSPEKSGWLSCVAKDGAETLLPTTTASVPTSQFKARAMSSGAGYDNLTPRTTQKLSSAASGAWVKNGQKATLEETINAVKADIAFAEDPRLQGPNGEARERRVRI